MPPVPPLSRRPISVRKTDESWCTALVVSTRLGCRTWPRSMVRPLGVYHRDVVTLTASVLERRNTWYATPLPNVCVPRRSEEHTSELQSRRDLVCRLLLEKKKKKYESVCYEIQILDNNL